MPVGRVVRIIGGFYYLLNECGETIVAVPRGKLRQSGDIYVGDLVDYELLPTAQGVIEKVHPRSSELKRPYVANVTQVALVFAHKDPDFNYVLIDRFLVMLEAYHFSPLLVFNKSDLVEAERAAENAGPYRKIGYRTLCTSTKTGQGRAEMLAELAGEATTLAGPSGVGKSALINMLAPQYQLKTGQVSEKIGRGRHTTREVQLLPLPEAKGFLFDTPGFTKLDLEFIPPGDLAQYFIEFAEYSPECRFVGCLHQQEPDCAVKTAVQEGKIFPWRYEHYLLFLEELKKGEARPYPRSGENRSKRR